MNGDPDGVPPRLSGDGNGDAQARELLRSARMDVPAAGSREAGTENVLRSYRQSRRTPWLWTAAAAVLGLGIGYVSFLRPRQDPVTSLVREQIPSASALTAAPGPLQAAAPNATRVEEAVPCAPVARSAGDSPLIDDFEDGDGRILRADRRAGSWSTFNDGTGLQRPGAGVLVHGERIPGGRGSSRFGMHSSGSKFTNWGASLAVELSPRRCYDASAYAGIAFWARGHSKVNAVVRMSQVVLEEFGGTCEHDCNDGHRREISLTNGWQLYQVRWEELTQAGFGAALKFDPRWLFSVEFQVLIENTPFDFWIDDVTFIER